MSIRGDAGGGNVMGDFYSIPFLQDDARTIASLTVAGAEHDCLRENGRYEYKLDKDGFLLKEIPGVVTRGKFTDKPDRGLIEPGNYVGTLRLVLLDRLSEKAVSEALVPVRSRKLGYDTEYRFMLEDIADRCADFLLQLESPAEILLKPDSTVDSATLAQRLYFLKSLLGGEDFQQALQRILAMPNTRWREDIRRVDVCRSARMGRHEVRQLAKSNRRMPVPKSHPIHAVMETIPEFIDVRDKRDTVDTPENRFVKHVLGIFLQTLEELVARLPADTARYPTLRDEIRELTDILEEVLADDLFKEVTSISVLPLNSPVLQRREGYRQVLRAWMLLELAARLSWEGGDDVYAAGSRDAASLYEYWVFFRLLDLVSKLFTLDQPPVETLLDTRDLVLKLKAGRHVAIKGKYGGAGRRLNVKFSYNRSFSYAPAYPSSGAWSRPMRPDYTLSLWPDGFSENAAEEQELITHVHFDAKYRVEQLGDLFGKADESDLDEESKEERRGNYKRADLLKMHAYRDAIRRSAGAYVIYPGTEKTNFQGFHEILPGLGAFPLRPQPLGDDGSCALLAFLKEIVAHVCNRTTQYEQGSFHRYRIHRDDPPDAIRDPLPEADERLQRSKPPVEEYVLHGWLNNDDHLDWVKRRGHYNFRTEDKRGSLRLHESVTGAAYLYLHGSDQYQGGGAMFRIISDGPRVFSSERLLEMGYPGEASQPFYLVFDVKPLTDTDILSKYDWDLRAISEVDNTRAAALPKNGIPLSSFMKGAKLKPL